MTINLQPDASPAVIAGENDGNDAGPPIPPASRTGVALLAGSFVLAMIIVVVAEAIRQSLH